MNGRLRNIAARALPAFVRKRLRPLRADFQPRTRRVKWGELRRLTPLSQRSGFDRGQPIDRYFIERFLDRHTADIRGQVLEFGDNTYTRRYGGEHVVVSDVLAEAPGNPRATLIADLGRADSLPVERYDCIICTQTLQYIFDLHAAVRNLHRALRPGGVILATVPGISPISADRWQSSWCWGFTAESTGRLFEELFPSDALEVVAHGNVLTAIAFLQGLASSELRPDELAIADVHYQMLITVRAMKR